ncbi:hypothetical protein F2981_04200 [Sinorhizobium meliloti]|nr:hypothetical protein [Sinorhizobium meliloti]
MKGEPTRADRRSRVQPRQVYCFAAAGRRGWNGRLAHRRRRAAFFISTASTDSRAAFTGRWRMPTASSSTLSFDLYNQAFALLAFAIWRKSCRSAEPEWWGRSDQTQAAARSPFASIRSPASRRTNPGACPRSNPHMHLFEACLASEERGIRPRRLANLADEIAQLAMDAVIDATVACVILRPRLAPFPGEKGRIVEPGHHFEWAWLLLLAERRAMAGDRRGPAAFRYREKYGTSPSGT